MSEVDRRSDLRILVGTNSRIIVELEALIDEAGRGAPYGRDLSIARTHAEETQFRLERALKAIDEVIGPA